MLSQTREELSQQVNFFTHNGGIINISLQAAQTEATNKAALVQDYEQQLAELRQENARLQSENDTVQAEAMLQFADKSVWEEEVDKWK